VDLKLGHYTITGLTKVFGIHETVDQATVTKKGRR